MQMEKTAVLERRIISKEEMEMRKRMGMIGMGITASMLILFPSTRMAYGSISVASAASIGLWRTGNQSL